MRARETASAHSVRCSSRFRRACGRQSTYPCDSLSCPKMQARDRLIVALDLSSRDEILSMVDELRGVAGIFKIGLQAFVANGPAIVREIVSSGERVFLDLKIHDIPNTAQHAVAQVAALGAAIVTIHIAGGEAMLRACADEIGRASCRERV